MEKLLKYFPLVKVDEQSHTISGIATAEQADKDGEICDYEGAVKAYTDWSREASESTKAAGQEVSWGNIRLQHGLQIAGKVSAPIIYDDQAKEIRIITDPADEDIWQKARKGLIRGFSHAGGYLFRKCNECKTSMPSGSYCPSCEKQVPVRYAPVLAEVSYVDNPCLKAATFEVVKADGTTELRKFQERTEEVDKTTVESSAKASGAAAQPAADQEVQKTVQQEAPAIDFEQITKAVAEHVLNSDAIRELLGKSTKYLVHGADGQMHLPYSDKDGKPNHRLMGAAWAALHGGYRGNKYAGPDKDKATARLKEIYAHEGMDTPSAKATKTVTDIFSKAAKKRGVKKDLDQVSRFADLLQQIAYLRLYAQYEADFEQDDSSLPADLQADLESLCETFLAMAEEETKELAASAAVTKGVIVDTDNPALAKAKSFAEHLNKAKKLATDHNESMQKCFGAMGKAFGLEDGEDGKEAKKAAGDSRITPEEADGEFGERDEKKKINPQAEGTENLSHSISGKAAEPTYTKAQVEEMVAKSVDETVRALVEALAKSDDSEDDDKEEKKAKKKKEASAGIGDRSAIASVGPVVRVMPVTKTQDGSDAAAPAASVDSTPFSAADMQKALTGDPEALRKFNAGVKKSNVIPASVAASLPGGRR